MSPLLLASLTIAPASLAAPPDPGDVLYEPEPPWEYPSPTLWFGELRSAEQDFALIEARWLRAQMVSRNEAVTAAEVARASAAYASVRAELLAQEGMLTAEVQNFARGLNDARGLMAVSSQDPLVVSEARQQLTAALDEAASRTELAVRSATSHLMSLERDGLAAREELERWWSLWQNVDWSQAFEGEDEARLARLDDARLGVEIAAEGLPAASKGLVMSALNQADAERRLREEKHTMAARLSNPDDPYQQGYLAEHIQALEQASVQRQRKLQEVLDARDEIEREMASLEQMRQATDAPVTDELLSRVVSLRTTYDRLFLGLPTLEAQVSADTWCRVVVRSAQLRLMLGEPGADNLLRNAAAAYGGVCEVLVAENLQDSAFAATWAQNALRLSREAPAHLVLNLGPGVWTLDGTPLVGGGAATFTVSPGVHRFEYLEQGRLSHVDERIDPGERLCVSLSADGGIGLDACAFGLEGERDGLPPPRTPYAGLRGELEAAKPPLPPQTYLAASGQWLRLTGLVPDTTQPDQLVLSSLDLIGGSLELGWRLGRSPHSPMVLSLAQELVYSSSPLALTRSLTSRLLPRERVALSWRGGRGEAHPTVSLGAGVLASFRVEEDTDEDGKLTAAESASLPPPFVDLGLGLDVQLAAQVDLRGQLRLTQNFWADTTFLPTPNLHMGLIRWF